MPEVEFKSTEFLKDSDLDSESGEESEDSLDDWNLFFIY